MTIWGFHASDLTVMGGFVLAFLYIGIRASRHIRSQEDFFLAGRRLGRLVTTFTNFGQATSSEHATWMVEGVMKNGASGILFAIGTPETPLIDVPMFLPIVPCSLAAAKEHLPDNIQTVGIPSGMIGSMEWLGVLAETGAKRLVSVERMHHFGPVWDGYGYWRECFEEIEIAP